MTYAYVDSCQLGKHSVARICTYSVHSIILCISETNGIIYLGCVSAVYAYCLHIFSCASAVTNCAAELSAIYWMCQCSEWWWVCFGFQWPDQVWISFYSIVLLSDGAFWGIFVIFNLCFSFIFRPSRTRARSKWRFYSCVWMCVYVYVCTVCFFIEFVFFTDGYLFIGQIHKSIMIIWSVRCNAIQLSFIKM